MVYSLITDEWGTIPPPSQNAIEDRAIIPAMFGSKFFDLQRLSRVQVATNLYTWIASLAIFSLGVGMNLISIAHDLGRGDPYHVLHSTELSTCALLAAIICVAVAIRRGIQRLAKSDDERSAGAQQKSRR